MAKVKILVDFDVREESFEGLGERAFEAGAVEDVPEAAAVVFKAHGLAENYERPDEKERQ